MSGEKGRSQSPYRVTVPATGDDVGNNGLVHVQRCHDGSIALRAGKREESAHVWLTRQQATDVALALMNAAHGSPSDDARSGWPCPRCRSTEPGLQDCFCARWPASDDASDQTSGAAS